MSKSLKELFGEWVKIEIFLADALKKIYHHLFQGRSRKLKVKGNKELNRKHTDTLSSTIVVSVMYQ